MKCPMHLCIGQELTPSVLGYYLKKNDSIFSHHRSHGYFLANKGSMKEMISEFYGKETGTNGGLAGSQELSCTKTNFYSGTILSGAFAMAVGDALQKYLKTNNISVAVIGDGGMEEGITFEAINLAHLMKLPVLFICENNMYSTHTNIKRSRTSLISDRVKGFKIKTILVKDQNIKKLDHILSKTINNIRKKKEPVFLEILTYRFNGHVGPEGDDHFNYRPKKEINYWKQKDPLIKFEKLINSQKIIDNIKKDVIKEISLSFNFAEKSKLAKKWEQFNFNHSYSTVKSFYKKRIFLAASRKIINHPLENHINYEQNK